MKEILEKLFLEQCLTPFEISEMFNVNISEIKHKLQYYKITKEPKDKKYELIRKTPFLKEQEFLLFGLLSGYAKIISNDKLVISCKNKNDLFWIKLRLGKYINVILNKHNLYSASFTHHGLNFYKKKFYENTKKIIPKNLENNFNDLSLAALFLQRGTYNKETIRFSTHQYTDEENKIFQNTLKLNFNIRSKICEYTKNDKQYYFLSVNKRNSEFLIKIIKPYLDEYKFFTADSKSRYMLEPPNVNQ